MKKAIAIIVLGLLWCNVGFAKPSILSIFHKGDSKKKLCTTIRDQGFAEHNNHAICFGRKKWTDHWHYFPEFKTEIITGIWMKGKKRKKYPQVYYIFENVTQRMTCGKILGTWWKCDYGNGKLKEIVREQDYTTEQEAWARVMYLAKNEDVIAKNKEVEEAKKEEEKARKKAEEEKKKKAEEKRIAEEKALEADYERLEAKHRRKCKKGYTNPKGFELGTPEYKSCIFDTEQQIIAKAEEKKRIAEEKKKAEEEKIAQENKLNEIDPDLIPIATGSGFFVSRDGHIITNEHVAGICELLAIKVGGKKHYLNVVTTDQVNDLGLLRGNYKNSKHLEIDTEGPNLGEEIVAMGYPLGGFTGAGVKITKGIVSSLSGQGNNYSEFQHDAATAPGSSGGPVLNKSAQVVGVVFAGVNKLKVLEDTKGHIVEGINFAISSQTLTAFLKANKVKYFKASQDKKLDTEAVAQIGDAATVKLYCLNTEEFYTALKKAETHSDVLLDLQ